jgi:hypothetical protein
MKSFDSCLYFSRPPSLKRYEKRYDVILTYAVSCLLSLLRYFGIIIASQKEEPRCLA